MAYGMIHGWLHTALDRNLSFEEMVLERCRGYGALLSLRDTPNAKLPQRIEPSLYHYEALQEAEEALCTWLRSSLAERRTRFTLEHEVAVNRAQETLTKCVKQNAQVLEWCQQALRLKSPTSEHDQFVHSLQEDLTKSVINTQSEQEALRKCTNQTFEQWEEETDQELREQISYHKKHWEEDLQRAVQATLWLCNVRQMLEKAQ